MAAKALGILLAWLGGILTGIFIMLGDELINFAQCCSPDKFPFPLIGSLSIWTSWIIMFSMVLVGNTLSIIGVIVYSRSSS